MDAPAFRLKQCAGMAFLRSASVKGGAADRSTCKRVLQAVSATQKRVYIWFAAEVALLHDMIGSETNTRSCTKQLQDSRATF